MKDYKSYINETSEPPVEYSEVQLNKHDINTTMRYLMEICSEMEKGQNGPGVNLDMNACGDWLNICANAYYLLKQVDQKLIK